MSIFPLRNTHYKSDMLFQKFSHGFRITLIIHLFFLETLTWVLLLQDKLSNSNLDNWFILPINGSLISWTRGRYLSDIDHALVNSNMLVKISSVYFVDYPSVSDHKPLMVYCKKFITDESFLLPKKKFVRWDRYKCLEQKKEICHHNKFWNS